MALELLFQANRFICKSTLDNKEVPTLSCYQAIKKNLGLIWGNYLRTSLNLGAYPFERGKSPWGSANQKQTLMTRGRSHEDPVGPAKHVSEWLNLGAHLLERENQYQ
ncbi:hypothetical protein QL285_039878 [Trifolium repens]|nr:hypothetical protein QL285_039878 [Trifolium repens]